MKASELIEKLQEQIDIHGDHDVVHTDESWTLPINEVTIIENECVEPFGPHTTSEDRYTLDRAFLIGDGQ